VPAESLAVGAIIMVRPGDRISADGIIVSGESAIDEAPMTGESTPVRKGVDAVVFAGTVNGDAVLRVRVTAAAADNTIARVVKLVEEAQESKAPTERFIDRFSRYYTPGVVVVAALVAIVPPLFFGNSWSEWIYKGLAILLIGCPCALVISTPAAIAASLSAGARRGLLMKGGAVLETLGKVTMVAFDKTGTLTAGKPQVTDIIAFGLSEAQVLSRAAVLEQGSSHPLALAILNRAKADGVPVPPAFELEALPGKGVSGKVGGETLDLLSPPATRERGALGAEQDARITALNDEGKSVSVLLVNGAAAGLIAMRDEPREDAKAGLSTLKSAGVKAMMLTGDNKRTAAAVAGMLGIDWRGEMMPEDKQRVVGELKREGFIVAKVGDGINDAPALAAADIGIAMGGGTDVALETADAAVLHGRVGDVARMIELSKRTMRNILQNITIALGLKAVFLVTTIAGITGLWPAILADTGATVLVTINALRLLRIKA
jgi:Cd2+/Zn2+-exporting ATPase